MKLRNKIKAWLRKALRHRLDQTNRKRLKKTEFTILSRNCLAGVLYHDLGLKFLSPVINLYFDAGDFIKFLQTPQKYLYGTMTEKTSDPYPIAQLADITLYGVHYQNYDELKEKWEERAKRIDWNNVYIMMSERDGCGEDDIKAFDALPYENKVIFVHHEMPEIKSACYLPGTALDGKDGHWVQALTSYKGRLTGKRYIDGFDYVEFFNSGTLKTRP